MQSQQTYQKTLVELASSSPLAPLEAALNRALTSNPQETRLDKARAIMRLPAEAITDEELEVALTEFQHLIDYWLDQFEKQIFDGSTLNQMLGQV